MTVQEHRDEAERLLAEAESWHEEAVARVYGSAWHRELEAQRNYFLAAAHIHAILGQPHG